MVALHQHRNAFLVKHHGYRSFRLVFMTVGFHDSIALFLSAQMRCTLIFPVSMAAAHGWSAHPIATRRCYTPALTSTLQKP
jgi:hypothetical protein